MDTEGHQSLVKALDRPASFDNWLLGTHYSKKYMTALRLKTQSSPISTSSGEKPGSLHNINGKSKRITPSSAVPGEGTALAASKAALSLDASNPRSREGPLRGNLEVLPCGSKSSTFTEKHEVGTVRSSRATLEHKDESLENVAMRDLLWESYYRMKESNTGVFPALLTPYQRAFWTYKSVEDQIHGGSEPFKTVPPNGLTPNPTLLKNSYNILDIPLNQRPVKVRRHPPSGPPSFAPNPSTSRWLRGVR